MKSSKQQLRPGLEFGRFYTTGARKISRQKSKVSSNLCRLFIKFLASAVKKISTKRKQTLVTLRLESTAFRFSSLCNRASRLKLRKPKSLINSALSNYTTLQLSVTHFCATVFTLVDFSGEKYRV